MDKRSWVEAARTVVWPDGIEFHLDAYFLRRSHDRAGTCRNHRRLVLRAFVYHSRVATRSHLGAAIRAIPHMAIAGDSVECGNCRVKLMKKAANMPPFL